MKTIKGPAIFLAQFADDQSPFSSLEEIASWASELGFKGVQIPSWVETFYRTGVPSFDNPNSYYAPNGLLFDLEKDPSETYSFTREYPGVAEELHSHLIKGQKALNSKVLPNMFNRL